MQKFSLLLILSTPNANLTGVVGERRVHKTDEIGIQIFYDNENRHTINHGSKVVSTNDG